MVSHLLYLPFPTFPTLPSSFLFFSFLLRPPFFLFFHPSSVATSFTLPPCHHPSLLPFHLYSSSLPIILTLLPSLLLSTFRSFLLPLHLTFYTTRHIKTVLHRYTFHSCPLYCVIIRTYSFSSSNSHPLSLPPSTPPPPGMRKCRVYVRSKVQTYQK